MSMNINYYSQFYKGTEQINQYGSSAGGKDTLVKYEFNMQDADGNKVMDKMSREETMQAIKDISSMYGDNVIVEFSGDGMAKLIEGKGYRNMPLSENAAAKRAEKQAMLDNDVVQKKNTHPIAAPGDNYAGQDDMEIFKQKDPKLYKEISDLNNSIINHKPGEKFGEKFMELHKRAANVLNGGVILQDDNYYNSMITNNMPSVYGDKNANGEYERKLFGVSEEADNLFKAYANAYYEIEKGYMDGTRVAYVQDDASETGYRQLTRDEEIEKLNNAYARQVTSFKRRNNPKITEALEENAKKIEQAKSSQNKGVTSDSIEELEKKRAELEKLPKDMEKNFFEAARLFTERFNAHKPGMVKLADILSGISVFGKFG